MINIALKCALYMRFEPLATFDAPFCSPRAVKMEYEWNVANHAQDRKSVQGEMTGYQVEMPPRQFAADLAPEAA